MKATKIVFAEFGLQKHFIRCRHELHIRDIQTILQVNEHRADNIIVISPPDQGPGGSMYKIQKLQNQRCLGANNDVNLALLEIRSTPMVEGLPSPSTLVFNRPIRGPLPQMHREPINIKNNDA